MKVCNKSTLILNTQNIKLTVEVSLICVSIYKMKYLTLGYVSNE